MKFWRDFVVELAVIEPGTPRKKGQHKGKSGGKTALGSELSNTRQGYYYWLGSDAHTMRDWLERRYKDKERWFNEHYVRILPSIRVSYHTCKKLHCLSKG